MELVDLILGPQEGKVTQVGDVDDGFPEGLLSLEEFVEVEDDEGHVIFDNLIEDFGVFFKEGTNCCGLDVSSVDHCGFWDFKVDFTGFEILGGSETNKHALGTESYGVFLLFVLDANALSEFSELGVSLFSLEFLSSLLMSDHPNVYGSEVKTQ